MRGRDPKSKYFYDVEVQEKKPLLPSRVQKMCKDLEDYDYIGLEIRAIAGTVEKKGDTYVLTARGSKQEYQLKAGEDLRKLVDGGKSALTLGGKVTEAKGADGKAVVTLEVATAKETPK